ncbi:MAG: hypothetical protein ABSE84_24045, partial [Isosphaeraceae bacterium]
QRINPREFATTGPRTPETAANYLLHRGLRQDGGGDQRGVSELHRDLPKVLENLENPNARCVLTIHSKPKAVLIGAEAFLSMLRGPSPEDRLLALQLGALVQGLESSASSDSLESEERQEALIGV